MHTSDSLQLCYLTMLIKDVSAPVFVCFAWRGADGGGSLSISFLMRISGRCLLSCEHLICSLSAQQEHDFAKRIEEVKPMFVEPRNKGSFAEVGNLHYIPAAHLQAIVMF